MLSLFEKDTRSTIFGFAKVKTMVSTRLQLLNQEEEYVPKRSRRVSFKKTAPADGDTWVEYVVIIDKQSIETRSYFRSKNTDKCVWDEPPSGASNIILFSDRRRRIMI
mmetsp:Transcript_7354/g.9358  ORF Transcript_7354/g.9358 Transcript_7354/m.9358 type:complete len:108 (+) Transcript_7354:301-624(+)